MLKGTRFMEPEGDPLRGVNVHVLFKVFHMSSQQLQWIQEPWKDLLGLLLPSGVTL
jgi:hypothetical protein